MLLFLIYCCIVVGGKLTLVGVVTALEFSDYICSLS